MEICRNCQKDKNQCGCAPLGDRKVAEKLLIPLIQGAKPEYPFDRNFFVRHKPHCKYAKIEKDQPEGVGFYHICPECFAGREWGGPKTLGLYEGNTSRFGGFSATAEAFPPSTVDDRVKFYRQKYGW